MMKQMAQMQKGGKLNMNALMGQKKGHEYPAEPTPPQVVDRIENRK